MGKFLKKHKNKIIALVVILAAAIFILVKMNASKNQLPFVTTTTVQAGDLVNSVSVTGTVESESSKKIFAKLSYPVDVNHVEVGDVVKEGDVLCELDTSNLQSTIAQQKATANSASAMNNNSISMAEKQYTQAKEDLANDMDGTIFQAEQAVIAAKQQLSTSEIALDGAIDSLQKAREDDRFSGVDEKSSFTISAANGRDQAYASYEAAKQNVINAEESLELAKNSSSQKMESLEDSIRTSKVAAGQTNSQWIGIETLEGDLADSTITSPVSGVVTGVYVTEGATATGLMYVIEDISDLKVKANLKEYDLTSITEGNVVEIKSDATGEEIYTGRVENIAPTTTKTPTGDNIEGTAGGNFSTEIGVDTKTTSLRIGTKARMEIIYEKKENTVFVAFESLLVDENGKQTILIPELEQGNEYVLKAIPVETGMETDFMVEIISDQIKPGDIILTSAQGFTDGMRVQIIPTTPEVPVAEVATSAEVEEVAAQHNVEITKE